MIVLHAAIYWITPSMLGLTVGVRRWQVTEEKSILVDNSDLLMKTSIICLVDIN
jgi:hypothetical protein